MFIFNHIDCVKEPNSIEEGRSVFTITEQSGFNRDQTMEIDTGFYTFNIAYTVFCLEVEKLYPNHGFVGYTNNQYQHLRRLFQQHGCYSRHFSNNSEFSTRFIISDRKKNLTFNYSSCFDNQIQDIDLYRHEFDNPSYVDCLSAVFSSVNDIFTSIEKKIPGLLFDDIKFKVAIDLKNEAVLTGIDDFKIFYNKLNLSPTYGYFKTKNSSPDEFKIYLADLYCSLVKESFGDIFPNTSKLTAAISQYQRLF